MLANQFRKYVLADQLCKSALANQLRKSVLADQLCKSPFVDQLCKSMLADQRCKSAFAAQFSVCTELNNKGTLQRQNFAVFMQQLGPATVAVTAGQ